MSNIGKKVQIIWNDAKIFSPQNRDISISKMETIGNIESEDENKIIIKNPITKNLSTGENHPEKQPTYYFIPKRMIEKLQEEGI